jgi:hypothetical protein
MKEKGSFKIWHFKTKELNITHTFNKVFLKKISFKEKKTKQNDDTCYNQDGSHKILFPTNLLNLDL